MKNFVQIAEWLLFDAIAIIIFIAYIIPALWTVRDVLGVVLASIGILAVGRYLVRWLRGKGIIGAPSPRPPRDS